MLSQVLIVFLFSESGILVMFFFWDQKGVWLRHSFRLMKRRPSRNEKSTILEESSLLFSLFLAQVRWVPLAMGTYWQFLIFDFSNFVLMPSRIFSSVYEIVWILGFDFTVLESFDFLDPESVSRGAPGLPVRVEYIIIQYRMYTNGNRSREHNPPTIFEMAEEIEDQRQYRKEAKSILDAYRITENMKIVGSNAKTKKGSQPKQTAHKPESSYANKVKQTLRELNANKKKQLENNKLAFKSHEHYRNCQLGPAEKHLIQSGLKLLIKLMDNKYQSHLNHCFQLIRLRGNTFGQQQSSRIRQWKLQRVLSAWQYEVMLSKIQRQRKQKQMMEQQKKQLRLAADFNYFYIVKKVFKKWSQQTKRILKIKQMELRERQIREEELLRVQQTTEQQSTGDNKKRQVVGNIELQHKIRGFLDDLKLEVENKDKPKTVKQSPKQSNSPVNQVNEQPVQSSPNNPQQEDTEAPNQQAVEIQQKIEINEINAEGSEGNEAEVEHKGPLTNEDLENRRKQLQKKAKQRKEALEKLKREKEEKRRQKEEEEQRIEKQIQSQQKKVRQEQYRRFMKQKKEEEEWQLREKELMRQAVEFDVIRVVKYYGWLPWVGLKQCNQEKAESLGRVLWEVLMRRKLLTFVEEVTRIGKEQLDRVESKMDGYYRRLLARRCIARLKQNKINEEALKQQLQIRKQVLTLKVYFKLWLRARGALQLQNYEWERPRMKKAECIHAMRLMRRGMEAVRSNREQQVEKRKINEHKAKIKQKIHAIVEEEPTINYDDFL